MEVNYILSSFENSTVHKDCKVFVQKLQISCKQSPRNSIMLENVWLAGESLFKWKWQEPECILLIIRSYLGCNSNFYLD